MCDQMKVVSDRYFTAFGELQNTADNVLTDWISPQHELARKAEAQIFQRCIDIERMQIGSHIQEGLQDFYRLQ